MMSDEYFIDTAVKFFTALDTPESLACSLLLRAGEWKQIATRRVLPVHYNNSYSYYGACAAVDFLRKLKFPSGIDTQLRAKEKFWESERKCCKANARLSPFVNLGPFGPGDEYIRRFFGRVRREVSSILGHVPDELLSRHGPGSTYEDKGLFTTVPDKMTSRPTVTASLRSLLPIWYESAWARALVTDRPHLSDPKTVPGDRFIAVPKDATTDRGISIGPSINTYFQLGVGDLLKKRLAAQGWRWDMRTAQDRHRKIARWASIEGHLSTIDLSSASDSICRNLVRLLLPTEWYDLLDCLRAKKTLINNQWVYLEKFSAMGNGFTFELETIIFRSFALALCTDDLQRRQVSVYGDDIIVPTALAPSLINSLRFAGFETNVSKTFVDSPFRESCGGDYFEGADVRPYILEEFPYEPQDWFSIANGIHRVLDRIDQHRGHPSNRIHYHCSKVVNNLKAVRSQIVARLPKRLRLYGPSALGDLVIRHDDPTSWTVRADPDCFQIRQVKVYSPISSKLALHHWSPEVQLASALYGVPSDGVIPRDCVTGHKEKWVSYS